ncbi:cysteine-rich CWC family protein [Duganella sp.]|uniref:cysteine-rich CWC family protein n=1 Tax=Duganella sp. TaxID=1904440 RepID=UPI0031DFA3DD
MSTCSRCGAQFSCAMKDADPAAPAQPCWCTTLPPAVAIPSAPGASCWCPDCLRQHILDMAQTPASPPLDNNA